MKIAKTIDKIEILNGSQWEMLTQHLLSPKMA